MPPGGLAASGTLSNFTSFTSVSPQLRRCMVPPPPSGIGMSATCSKPSVSR